jgi:hypothetical protein
MHVCMDEYGSQLATPCLLLPRWGKSLGSKAAMAGTPSVLGELGPRAWPEAYHPLVRPGFETGRSEDPEVVGTALLDWGKIGKGEK